ncbi:hypothetical protein [Sphingomonas bacterium]|uniref:hypothetical protein n=1 Tax=Sphingomonas bacterium TaxID=1895847 RepID=UPI001577671B|nr:hypothetical protein [Sphingomonas bacterium]
MLLALLIQTADPAALIAGEKLRTTAETRCIANPDTTDITVCGRRHADRFRVPFATPTVARRDDVVAERGELLHRNTPIQDMGPFLVGGGEMGVKVGVGMGIDVGAGKTTVGGLRQLAP